MLKISYNGKEAVAYKDFDDVWWLEVAGTVYGWFDSREDLLSRLAHFM